MLTEPAIALAERSLAAERALKRENYLLRVFAFTLLWVVSLSTWGAAKGCLSCHEGIERFTDGPMMDTIVALGTANGDPAGCVICHGGTPSATDAAAAHQGAPKALAEGNGPQRFYPDPGSVWIADRTCGQCHAGYAERLGQVADEHRGRQAAGQPLVLGSVQGDHKVHWGNYDSVKDDRRTRHPASAPTPTRNT